jgi:low affinity Fe/Cu permease
MLRRADRREIGAGFALHCAPYGRLEELLMSSASHSGAPAAGGTPPRTARPRHEPPDSDAPLGSMPSTSSAAYATHSPILTAFDRFASAVTRWAGTPLAFCAAVLVIAAWAISGPVFHFSENWQLVINTGTTIITFLMVFLIQQSQNKDSVAMHLKLNELLASNRQASNRLVGIEELDEQDLRDLAAFYVRLAARAKEMGGVKETHSIDDEGMPELPDSPRPVAAPVEGAAATKLATTKGAR